MHVLQVASGDFFSTYGGGQVYVKNLVDEIIRLGVVKVSILSFTGAEGIHKKEYHGSNIFETGELTNNDLSNLIKQIAPDVIHTHSHEAQVCYVGQSLSIPTVVTIHSGSIVCTGGSLLDCHDTICQVPASHKNCLKCTLRNIRTGLRWYPLMRLLPAAQYTALGNLLNRLPFIYFVTPIGQAALSIKSKQEEWQTIINDCSLMIAPSEAIKNAMLRNGLPKDRVTVLPHGIPLTEDVPPFPSTEEGIRFFYVGRINYEKGIHIMLNAFHRLTVPKVELHLIGGSGKNVENRYEKQLRKKFSEDKRIIWHGKVSPNQLFQVIKDYHISIAPSICLEVYGLNIAESQSMGKPVLATRCGGAEMQIKDGVNGWLIPLNDVNAMAKKMEEIINMNYNALASISQKCHTLSIHQHTNALILLYKEQIHI